MGQVQIAQELWHAWNTGIHEGVLEHLCEDAVVRPVETTFQTFRGREEIDRLRRELEELGVRISSTPFTWEEHGNCVIVRGKSRIVQHGDPMDLDLAWLFRFRGEQVDLVQTFLSYEEAVAFAGRP